MSTIRTRKRGKTYSYIFEAGLNDKGKRKVIEKGGYRTKAEAYEAGVAAYTDWKHGNIGITSDRITVDDFFSHWLGKVVPHNVGLSTIISYQKDYQRKIQPYLGSKILQEVKPSDIDHLFQTLFEKGYGHSYIETTRSILKCGFDYAVYPCELIQSNPVVYVKIPKNAPTNIIKRTIIEGDILTSVSGRFPFGNKYHIPMILQYHTGMRVSEVLGLTWEKVDFQKGTLLVNQQAKNIPGIGLVLAKPKTSSSIRTIFLDKQILDELLRWKNFQDEQKEALGDGYLLTYITDQDRRIKEQSVLFTLPPDCTPIEPICTTENGHMVKYASYQRILRNYQLNTHSFRYTHTTKLFEAGAPIKDISNRIGHSNITTTLNIYTKVTEQMSRTTVDLFEKEVLHADKPTNADK